LKVFAVRVGDKYGIEYETYLKSKLDITFINEDEHPFILQWNKMRFMEMDINEHICVIDIDIELLNDYEELFNYPIKRGEFVGIKAWWKDTHNPNYSLNGGFYKYYPKDVKYIADKFRSDPKKWMNYYIDNGTTIGPVNGEQYFVEDSVKERLELKFVPETWVTKWYDELSIKERAVANTMYPGEWLHLGEFNPDIKLVHYPNQGARNVEL